MAEIKYLEINANDRSIIIPAGENLLGVENDNEGTRKYFICPKIVGDNIDLTKSDVYINVQNASGEKSGKDRYLAQRQCQICSLRAGKRLGKRVAYHFCYR